MPRAFRITHADLQEHGFSEDCPQCRHNEVFGKSKEGHAHTDECRRRFLDRFMSTPKGRARLIAYEERVDRAISDRTTTQHETTAANDVLQPRPNGLDNGAPPSIVPGGDDSGAAASSNIPLTNNDKFLKDKPLRSMSRQFSSPAPSPLQRPTASPSQEEILQPETSSSHRGYDPPGPNEGDIDMDFHFLGHLGPEEGDDVSLMLLEQLGTVSSATKESRGLAREKRRTFNRIVSEIYSPPRVTAEIQRSGFKHLRAGLALDLTVSDPDDGQPWDFSRRDKREKARQPIRVSQPILLIGSPMCTAFSTWQRLNDARSTNVEARQQAYAKACQHIKFVASLYRAGVAIVPADQCQFGATVPRGPDAGRPVKKPTGFMSNSLEILRSLGKRCQGKHGECSRTQRGRHAPCCGSTCKAMARYPRGLCRAMLHGLAAQLRADGRLQPGCYGIQAVDDD